MKALSLKQPWLNLILWKYKTLETRWWSRSFRGDLLLCASKKSDSLKDFNSLCVLDFHSLITQVQHDGHNTNIFQPNGVALCVVKVVDIRPMQPTNTFRSSDADEALVPYNAERFCWVIEDVRPIAPFPVKGQLGIFEVPLTDKQLIYL